MGRYGAAKICNVRGYDDLFFETNHGLFRIVNMSLWKDPNRFFQVLVESNIFVCIDPSATLAM